MPFFLKKEGDATAYLYITHYRVNSLRCPLLEIQARWYNVTSCPKSADVLLGKGENHKLFTDHGEHSLVASSVAELSIDIPVQYLADNHLECGTRR